MSASASTLRIGIIGLGNMGSAHLHWIRTEQKVARLTVTAICDVDQAKLDKFAKGAAHESALPAFTDSAVMIRSGLVDAVIIATPHYDHTTIGIDAIGQGLHVLVEKPISVHQVDAQRLIDAYAKRPKATQVFGAMFNQRTDPRYQKLRNLVTSGELGQIRRINWTITDWYRTQRYYDSGGWRATWRGEGGGVLMNQCPHNLDLLQWIFGMPTKVRGFCQMGRWHDIEVEDAVTAYLEYRNGATGTFITTTGEFPGTNRLEVACDRGKVVVEGGELKWTRTVQPVPVNIRTSPDSFASIDTWDVKVNTPGDNPQHLGILRNFTAAVLDGTPLLAPAEEGINAVSLCNAMVLSSLLDRTLTLPLDSDLVESQYRKLADGSKYQKTVTAANVDMSKSFA